MHGVRHRARRVASQAWAGNAHVCRRLLSDGAHPQHNRPRPLDRRRHRASTGGAGDNNGLHTPMQVRAARQDQPLSLVEQLFPAESKRYEAQQKAASRSIPRVSISSSPSIRRPVVRESKDDAALKSPAARELAAQMKEIGPMTSVLVLRNASDYLVEEDFRRLIPQGQHIEGWALEQGDIIKVIPGRDLATLAQDGSYYLLFSSPLSAFTYQGHVNRIHAMAAKHRPSSLNSPLAPSPGQTIDGIDAHAAMSAYALVPPTQQLELRQLKPPLSPMVESIVHHTGYASIVNRPERMPFEARLTLEGPQLNANRIRYILLESGRDRALGWSGGDELDVRVTRWAPQHLPSPLDPNGSAWTSVLQRTEADQMSRDFARLAGHSRDDGGPQQLQQQQRRRAPSAVYIVGFHTERAAQLFVQHWHRQPMAMPGEPEELKEGDMAPLANVHMLW